MPSKINLVALVAGISTLILIVISVFVPWWQFTVGRPTIAQVNFSPVNFNAALFGTTLTVPLIFAMNLACILTLSSGGIIMLIYSLKPNKPYSKRLLGFGYKQPIFAVVLFVIELIALTAVAGIVWGFAFPLMGSGSLQIPQQMIPGGGVSVSVGVIAAFEWPFYFAVIVAGLCITARLSHGRIMTGKEPLAPIVQ
jgi:hypothetical protein